MGSTKNSQSELLSYDGRKYAYLTYFSLATNTARSYSQKMELLHAICFLQTKMHKKDPVKYNNCLSLLQVIFGREFSEKSDAIGDDSLLIGLSIICDDLLYGVDEDLEVPKDCSTLKDVKNKIIKYIKEEWMPF